jgi:hypothetical protein
MIVFMWKTDRSWACVWVGTLASQLLIFKEILKESKLS